MMCQVHLNDLVAKDNFYRRLDKDKIFDRLFGNVFIGLRQTAPFAPLFFFIFDLLRFLDELTLAARLTESVKGIIRRKSKKPY